MQKPAAKKKLKSIFSHFTDVLLQAYKYGGGRFRTHEDGKEPGEWFEMILDGNSIWIVDEKEKLRVPNEGWLTVEMALSRWEYEIPAPKIITSATEKRIIL